MYVVKNIKARQAHSLPDRVGRAVGPFPRELFQQPEVINPYNPEPEKWLVCSVCGGRELEVNVEFHICGEDDERDDA